MGPRSSWGLLLLLGCRPSEAEIPARSEASDRGTPVSPVRLAITNHDDTPLACDAIVAERAARLGFAALAEVTPPKDFLAGCDASAARCGTLPIPDDLPPPARCTVTLRENLLVVERPAGNDVIRGFEVWLDRSITAAEAPELNRTSASAVTIDGKVVTLAGITNRAMHEHGGDAAQIGHMMVAVDNPTGRTLAFTVLGIEWLTDHSCGLPSEVRALPAVIRTLPRELPPGRSELEIMFDDQGAYQAHCDRFASRAQLRIEGQEIAVTVEHEVTREEPLRE